MRSLALALAGGLCLITAPAQAQVEPAPRPPVCRMAAQPWAGARTAEAASRPTALEPARVFVGQPVRFRLHPDGEVTYLSLPQGEGEAASFGGMAPLLIEQAGLYRVSLERSSWIDVVANGDPAKALRFGPGTPCSGARKSVEFRLEAGAHVLEMSGNEQAELGVLVERIGA